MNNNGLYSPIYQLREKHAYLADLLETIYGKNCFQVSQYSANQLAWLARGYIIIYLCVLGIVSIPFVFNWF